MERVTEGAAAWLSAFETAMTDGDRDTLGSLISENANWRDLAAFTWNIKQFHGREAIVDYLLETQDDIHPTGFRIDDEFPVEAVSHVAHLPGEVYEVDFRFDTAAGTADALMNISEDVSSPVGWVAELLFTRLRSLREHPAVWPQFGRYSQDHLENESKTLAERREYIDRDPDVLIVGGGHNGVFMSVELARLGIDSLVIDRFPRAGDAWRQRYESLVLHMPHGMMQFPHLPFPVSFPDYIAKERLSDWFESYVRAFDLNLWTSTEFLGGSYDEATGRWTVQMRLADGSIREMHPRDVVLAIGHTGTPRMPDLPGLDSFAGSVTHSSSFRSGTEFAGKRVAVIGSGTSAHDIAFDISRKGGEATLFQRGPTCVVDLATANLNYGAFNTRDVPTDVVDKRWLSTFIKPLMIPNFKAMTVYSDQADAELLKGLESVGFKLDKDEGGWFAKYFVTGGGYYLNVGASDAIIRGDIGVRQLADVSAAEPGGLRTVDGNLLEYDAIVCATGYDNEQRALENFFGPELAARVGRVGGFDENGEPERNGYRPIPSQPHLFINGGGISPGRWYAGVLSLIIQADREGLIPDHFTAADHASRSPSGDEKPALVVA